MIPSVREEIIRASIAIGGKLEELTPEMAETTRGALLQRYGAHPSFELNTNNLRNYAAVQHPDSWEWVNEFVGDEPVILFYDWPNERTMFRTHGKDVKAILANCFMFVFYITNESYDYLLAQNDHDYIIGAGTAKPWVESLAPRHDEWAKTLTKGAEKSDDDR